MLVLIRQTTFRKISVGFSRWHAASVGEFRHLTEVRPGLSGISRFSDVAGLSISPTSDSKSYRAITLTPRVLIVFPWAREHARAPGKYICICNLRTRIMSNVFSIHIHTSYFACGEIVWKDGISSTKWRKLARVRVCITERWYHGCKSELR